MKTIKSKLQIVSVISYAIIGILFTLLFIYMGTSEHISIQKARDSRTYHTIVNYSVKEISDSSAPIGIRKEYSWTMDSITTNDTTLAFYVVHHYAEVYFDDELMYRLMPEETNKIGKSISSNWITIPVYPEDSGKLVRVIVTPVYESIRNREIEFSLGSLYNLYSTQLKKDFPQLVLSAACLIFGFLIMLLQLAFLYYKRTQSWDMFYLGHFILTLGIWRITDTRFSPWLFRGNPMLLGYLSIGTIFFAGIPFTLYLKECFPNRKNTLILIVSLLTSGTACTAILCQLLGIADLRESLPLAHIMIGMIAVTIILTVIKDKREKDTPPQKMEILRVLILIAGVLADVIMYYINNSSSGLLFTLFGVLCYTLLLFGQNLVQMNQKAYTDVHTGLYNKNRWNDLINLSVARKEPIGIIVLDINGLKQINDTIGHEAGDQIILSFADILRSVIPKPNAICRWGGDEFAVMLKHPKQDIVEQYLKEIRIHVDRYNESHPEPKLYYAVGYALSTEFPDLPQKALLGKADERMYENKKKWHMEHADK